MPCLVEEPIVWFSGDIVTVWYSNSNTVGKKKQTHQLIPSYNMKYSLDFAMLKKNPKTTTKKPYKTLAYEKAYLDYLRV